MKTREGRTDKSLKRIIFGFAVFIFLTACVQPVSSGGAPTSVFVITPAQDPYIQTFSNYIDLREQAGLETKSIIQVEGSDPFIYLMRPRGGQGVTDDEMKDIMALALKTVNIFETRKGLRHEDIDIPFTRPFSQRIVVVKDGRMPTLLSNMGEATISVDNKYYTSIVNLSGPAKSGSQEFANAWAVIQAVCLAYAGNFKDADGVCNVIAANGAAGWVGMEADEAEQLISSYGSTELGYLGSRDIRYRYIDFVVDEFRRDK